MTPNIVAANILYRAYRDNTPNEKVPAEILKLLNDELFIDTGYGRQRFYSSSYSEIQRAIESCSNAVVSHYIKLAAEIKRQWRSS